MVLKGRHSTRFPATKVLVPVEDLWAIAANWPPRKPAAGHPLRHCGPGGEVQPVSPRSTNKRAYNVAVSDGTQRWLCYFPYVETGTVIISMGEPATLGRVRHFPNTASVIGSKKKKTKRWCCSRDGSCAHADDVSALTQITKRAGWSSLSSTAVPFDQRCLWMAARPSVAGSPMEMITVPFHVLEVATASA